MMLRSTDNIIDVDHNIDCKIGVISFHQVIICFYNGIKDDVKLIFVYICWINKPNSILNMWLKLEILCIFLISFNLCRCLWIIFYLPMFYLVYLNNSTWSFSILGSRELLVPMLKKAEDGKSVHDILADAQGEIKFENIKRDQTYRHN